MQRWLLVVWAFQYVRTSPSWYVLRIHDSREQAYDDFAATEVPPCYDGLGLLCWDFLHGLMAWAAKDRYQSTGKAMGTLWKAPRDDANFRSMIERTFRVEVTQPAPLPPTPRPEFVE